MGVSKSVTKAVTSTECLTNRVILRFVPLGEKWLGSFVSILDTMLGSPGRDVSGCCVSGDGDSFVSGHRRHFSMGPGYRPTDAPAVRRALESGLRPLAVGRHVLTNTVDTDLLSPLYLVAATARCAFDLTVFRNRVVTSPLFVRAGNYCPRAWCCRYPRCWSAPLSWRASTVGFSCRAAMRYHGLPVVQGANQVHLLVATGRRFSVVGRRCSMQPTSDSVIAKFLPGAATS